MRVQRCLLRLLLSPPLPLETGFGAGAGAGGEGAGAGRELARV